jgi:hypothetical protein
MVTASGPGADLLANGGRKCYNYRLRQLLIFVGCAAALENRHGG